MCACRYNEAMVNPETSELDAWTVAHAAAKAASELDAAKAARFALADAGRLRETSWGDPAAVLQWNPATGWGSLLPADDPQRDLLELYLPICSGTTRHPVTVGHLGQSL